MDIISLASGGGLFDYTLREIGMNIKFQCENDPIALKILDKAFPESHKHTDIFTLTKDKLKNDYQVNNLNDCTFVATLCCKPFSNMGKHKGKSKDTYMCSNLIKLIDDCKPRFVLSENVTGFINHSDGLSYFAKELEKINYWGISFNIPASLFGAPHERNRVFSIFVRDRVKANHTNIDLSNICIDIMNKLNMSIDPAIFNGRYVNEPNINSVIFAKPTESDINYLRILGNGVEYHTGKFIAAILKECNDYYYGNDLMETVNDANSNNYIGFFPIVKLILDTIIPNELKDSHNESFKVLNKQHIVFNIQRKRKLHKPKAWWSTPLASDGNIGSAYVHSIISNFYPEAPSQYIYRNPELVGWLMGIRPDLNDIIKQFV